MNTDTHKRPVTRTPDDACDGRAPQRNPDDLASVLSLGPEDTSFASMKKRGKHGSADTDTEADDGAAPAAPARVYLNVYDLMESQDKGKASLGSDALSAVGMGIHHSGLEVFGEEWSFGCDPSGRNDPTTEGIFAVYPRTACGCFRAQIDLGEVPPALSPAVLGEVLAQLRPSWRACTYHILDRNCNDFTKALVGAIDARCSSALSSKVPGWINRAAGAGSVVVPNTLLNKITAALSPPAAFLAKDLVNYVDIAVNTNYPMPPPLPALRLPSEVEEEGRRLREAEAAAASKAPSSVLGGISGFGAAVKGLASKAVTAVRTTIISHVDEADRKDYVARFSSQGARGEDLLSAYRCTVLHINRPQSAKVFIARDCIRLFGGSGDGEGSTEAPLSLTISYRDVTAYTFGAVVKPARSDGNALPQFIPVAHDSGRTDCIMLFVNIASRGPSGTRVIPLLDLSFIGNAIISGAANLVSNAHRTIAQNAMCYVDVAWREYRGVSETGMTDYL